VDTQHDIQKRETWSINTVSDNQIAIFTEITTEEVLQALEAEGKKYAGLHVDMSEAEPRKYVKDAAANIKAMLKHLDSQRIIKTRDFRNNVEKEAAAIKQRLEDANAPYTLLIDAYAHDCKVIRDEENAIHAAISLQLEIEDNHEYALLMDAKVMADKAEAVQAQKERDERIATEAASAAVEKERRDREFEEAKIRRGHEQRDNDMAHKARVNNDILFALLEVPHMEDSTARAIIKAIYNNQIPSVTINY
jgi:hypothetical protein